MASAAMDDRSMIAELKDLLKKLKSYRRRVEAEESLSPSKERYTEALREMLVRKTAILEPLVTELTGRQHYAQFGQVRNIWDTALNPGGYLPSKLTALGYCIDAANEAIGKTETGAVHPKVDGMVETGTDADSPVRLFDRLGFHSKVVEASRSLFESRHYASAILEAFKAVNSAVKDKSGLALDGKNLMAQAFSEANPRIILNELKTQSDRDEQEGFRFLFMGALQGIRNPKAHDIVQQEDPYLTLEYLGFASLLMKKISFWTLSQE